MFGLKFVVLTATALALASCAKPSNDSASAKPVNSAAGEGAPQGGQVGTGSTACPFSVDPASYAVSIPETTKLLDSIPDGKYVLVTIKAHRTALTSPETEVFASGAKILLKEPGRVGASDTIQMIVQDPKTAVTAGNLSFPLDFEMNKGKITWGRFNDYEPKIKTDSQSVTVVPVIKEFDDKVLKENTGRHSFNVFARKRLSGYQSVVKLSQSDFGVIKGTIAIESDAVRFIIELPRGSSSVELIESTYELVFVPRSKAKAPDCGGNASAVRVLGT